MQIYICHIAMNKVYLTNYCILLIFDFVCNTEMSTLPTSCITTKLDLSRG